MTSRLPVPFRVPAFASWASCPAGEFRPPHGRPTASPHMPETDHNGVSMFHTRETRAGPGALSTPGAAVFPSRRSVRGCRLPPHSGRPLPSRHNHPARDAVVTKHQREFPYGRPTGPSPHLWPPRLGRRPLGFPVSSAPDRSGTSHARHGGDRSNTDP